MNPAIVSDYTAQVDANWNVYISSVISGAVLQTASYVELERRPALIQAIEALHTQFSRHQLAHSTAFVTLAEMIFPRDPQTHEFRVDEWLDLTVALHALLSPEDVEYLNTRIVSALQVYFMEHPDDLLIQLHGDFRVGRAEFDKWVQNVAWYRTVCAIVLFWLPEDFKVADAALREQFKQERGG